MRDRVGHSIVFVFILLGIIYVFQADILRFLDSLKEPALRGPLKDSLLLILDIFGRVFGLLKTILVYLADMVIRVLSQVKDLYSGILWAFGLLKRILGAILGLLGLLGSKL